MEFLLAAAPLAAFFASAFAYFRTKNKIVLFQWGKFTNKREGVKNHMPNPNDPSYVINEPDWVEFVDYKYWLRLKPNPGFNVPGLGYWSKAKGRRR